MKKIISSFIYASLLVALSPVNSIQAADEPDMSYKSSGFNAIMKLGTDLQKAIKPKYKDQINSQCISLVTDMMPYVKPEEAKYEGMEPMRMVFISAGFTDLMNHVAHAKAIDHIQKGYFQKYLVDLAAETGEKEQHDLPNIQDKKYWSEDVMNEQTGNFNQMVGAAVAIDMSHLYLGHYKKYLDKLVDAQGKPIVDAEGHPVPINNLLTSGEWEDSLKIGARNALDCGMGVDGIKALYDAIDKMPKRPAWTAYFLPANVKVDKVKKTLETIEKKFFAGEE